MKKHVVKISVIFAIMIVVCNMFVLDFLCKNAAEIDAKSAVDGMIITNGLTIISLAVTVWLGISIYNSIEKKEFADIKEEFTEAKNEIETCLQISNEVKAYTKQQLVNQMYKTGDISCDYIAKHFDKDVDEEKKIPSERYADLLTIDILLEKAYQEHNRERRKKWAEIAREKIERYKGKFEKRSEIENGYLNYRDADFLFFIGESCVGNERYNIYEKAKDLFLKSAECFGIEVLCDRERFFRKSSEMQRLSIYFSNAIGQCYAFMMLTPNLSADVFEDMKTNANEYLSYVVTFSAYCGEREVYYRNYGCFLENTAKNMDDMERAYKQYKKAFATNSREPRTYHVLISNLNKRIREALHIDMRTPQSGRKTPIYQYEAALVLDIEKIETLINEMGVYIEFAIDFFPDNADWYAFSIYRKIYEMRLKNSFDKLKDGMRLADIKQDVIRIDLLNGDNNLCKVAKMEVNDLINYSNS